MAERIQVFAATVAEGRVPTSRDRQAARFECLDATLRRRIERGRFTLEAAMIRTETLARL